MFLNIFSVKCLSALVPILNLYFDKVEKDFVKSLLSRHPKLTQNDIRICLSTQGDLPLSELENIEGSVEGLSLCPFIRCHQIQMSHLSLGSVLFYEGRAQGFFENRVEGVLRRCHNSVIGIRKDVAVRSFVTNGCSVGFYYYGY